jgi:uncharacterized membrane protein
MRQSTLKAMLAFAFALLLAEPFAASAGAQEEKSFDLPSANVVADVQPDGSVLVTEEIAYDFIGSFEGGYREIPVADGVSVTDVSVGENGRRYSPGASAELGSSGAPGTFGTADLGDAYRIVWHYRASDEERTFTLRYRLEDLAVAYDDVVDLYWQAWGEEWHEPLGKLQAEVLLPGEPNKGEVKVFGHPASVGGATSLGQAGNSPMLVAIDVPDEQFVEMRVVFPRELLTSSGGARVEAGNGLQKIMNQEAEEARSEARSEARDARQQQLEALLGLLFVFGLGGVILTLGFVAWLFGRRGGSRWYGGHGDSSYGSGGEFTGGGGDGRGGGGGGAW